MQPPKNRTNIIKRKKNKNIKKAKSLKKVDGKQLLRYFFIALLMLLVLSAGFFTYKAYNYFIYGKKIFALKKINITGGNISTRQKEKLIRLSGLYKGENLYDIDLKRVSRLIASDRWVKNVTVYKKYPAQIVIVLKKRTIFAIISKKNLYYISKSGYVLGRADSASGYNYPVITGLSKGGQGDYFSGIKKVIRFLSTTNPSVISGYIGEVHLEKDGGIAVYTDSGVLIKFGIGRYKNKLKTLKRLFYEINRLHIKYNNYINLEYKDEAVIAVNQGSRVLPANYKKPNTSSDVFK